MVENEYLLQNGISNINLISDFRLKETATKLLCCQTPQKMLKSDKDNSL